MVEGRAARHASGQPEPLLLPAFPHTTTERDHARRVVLRHRRLRAWCLPTCTGPLHMLVNNPGVMATPEMRTPEGWEFQFATNHLGHFALATGLRPAPAADGGARVVSLSSVGHVAAPVDFDDIHVKTRPYEPTVAYGQSKTANALCAVEAARCWAADGNAVHPARSWTAT